MEFRHELIDGDPPAAAQMACAVTDLTGDGHPDLLVGGNEPDPAVYWYENPGDGSGDWGRHVVNRGTPVCPGVTLGDLTGNGRLDLITGGPWNGYEAHWFEQPADPRETWPAHLFCNDFHKYHDLAFADVDDDGDPELLFLSQYTDVACYYEIPDEPREHWPRENRTYVDAGLDKTEGIQVLDVDGDGDTELVLGRNVYARTDDAGEAWARQARIAPDWADERVRVVAGDVDDDGTVEVVLSEGELPELGPTDADGRVAVCRPPDWEPEVLRDDLHNPHSLQLADFDGDGRLDVYVAESDYGDYEGGRHFVYRTLADGTFEEHLVFDGVATHEAQAVDLTGNGRPDVVGKSDTDDAHVDVWYNDG